MRIPNLKVIGSIAFIFLLAIFVWAFRNLVQPTAAQNFTTRASGTSPITGSGIPPTRIATPATRIERSRNWHSRAREKHLRIASEALTIDEDLIELLELSAREAYELNEILAQFLRRLRSEELSHAYVSVTETGDEEIIVPGFPAFDRTEIVSRFRDEVAAKLGADVGNFIAEEIQWDSNLAVGNFEMRLAVHRGDDGAERIVFTRKVRAPENGDPGAPGQPCGPKVRINFAPTVRITTNSILAFGINPRYAHLLSAKKTLPRRP